MGATAAEFDVTPDLDLTPKTALKLSVAHFITLKRFDKAFSVIERAKLDGIITSDEWVKISEECLRRLDEHNAERFKPADDMRALMSICTAPYTK